MNINDLKLVQDKDGYFYIHKYRLNTDDSFLQCGYNEFLYPDGKLEIIYYIR
jgi:hypothetical protein